ncbi:hypothetical protein E2C01_063821 [Portunus trituberculatus]|uniref:Uncharacterized protein n=1 Tax=Portunus trituberculatus TaxID=210409 RepID=A0A5B7HA63_PORTR|nr:hypothetical protein [Portunus trituberculatus]
MRLHDDSLSRFTPRLASVGWVTPDICSPLTGDNAHAQLLFGLLYWLVLSRRKRRIEKYGRDNGFFEDKL